MIKINFTDLQLIFNIRVNFIEWLFSIISYLDLSLYVDVSYLDPLLPAWSKVNRRRQCVGN